MPSVKIIGLGIFLTYGSRIHSTVCTCKKNRKIDSLTPNILEFNIYYLHFFYVFLFQACYLLTLDWTEQPYIRDHYT